MKNPQNERLPNCKACLLARLFENYSKKRDKDKKQNKKHFKNFRPSPRSSSRRCRRVLVERRPRNSSSRPSCFFLRP